MYLAPKKSTSIAPASLARFEDRMMDFQREMNGLLSSFFNTEKFAEPLTFTPIYPSVDIREKNNKYFLDADLPGLNESDIDIDFRNNTLIIKGEKKTESKSSDDGYVCVERSYGSFSREIPFDDQVDQDNIKAELKDGVLHVELPKKEKSKTSSKKIPIRH